MATIISISVLLPFPRHANVSIPPESKPEVVVVPEVPPILAKIAQCESQGRQFNDDGTVHRGVQNHQDVGKYQINEKYHLKASQALGMDIYTLAGNTQYALYLYRHEGTTPWNWSKWCWGE